MAISMKSNFSPYLTFSKALPAPSVLGCLALILFLLAPAIAKADDFVEVAKTTPSSASNSSKIGAMETVDVSGDWAVAGAREVWVFHRNQGGTDNWGAVKQLTPSTGSSAQGFGASVSIFNEVIAVGAPNESIGLPTRFNAGAVYVFRKNLGGTDNWGEEKRLTSVETVVDGDGFGSDVAAGPGRLLVGAPQVSNSNPGGGMAQLFEDSGVGVNAWPHLTTLTASDGTGSDGFGTRVALDSTTAAVAATSRYPDKKAYIYEQNNGGVDNWGEIKVPAQSTGPGSFGVGLALDGDTLVVSNHGTVELFGRHEGGSNSWGGLQSIAGTHTSFGNAIDVSGQFVLVGNVSDSSAQGKASLYQLNVSARGPMWSFFGDLTASDGAAGDLFSSGLAIDLETVVIGAPEDDNAEGSSAGAIYVYDFLPAVDLGITKDDGIETLARGAQTTYVIQATNYSSEAVSDAVVSDEVQLGVVNTAESSWTCAPDAGSTLATSCPAGGTVAQFAAGVLVDLGAGESLTFLYTLDTDSFQPPATLVNQASIVPPTGFGDPEPANNSASDTNTFVTAADISVMVTAATQTPNAGESFIFEAEVASAGPSTGTSQLSIELPDGLTYVGSAVGDGGVERGESGPPCNELDSRGGSTFLTCNVGLAAGTSVVLEVEAMVDVGFNGVARSHWQVDFLSGTDDNPDNDEVFVDTFVGFDPHIFSDGFESGSASAWSP